MRKAIEKLKTFLTSIIESPKYEINVGFISNQLQSGYVYYRYKLEKLGYVYFFSKGVLKNLKTR